MIIEFSGWLNEDGVIDIINAIYNIVKIIRIVVPIGLIVMTTLDITKKIIDPKEKDGQKKIMIRIISAIIVFFIPLFIKFVFTLADIDVDNLSIDNISSDSKSSKLSTLNILNCPSTTHRYNPGDQITLHTNIPKTYQGSIKWVPRVDHNVFKIVSNVNESSIILEVIEKPNHCITDVSVMAGGLENNCVIMVSNCG